jgi:hypothetical protein
MVNSGLNIDANEDQINPFHIVTDLNENPDLDKWTTFDDHGRHAKKWTPVEHGTSAGCSMLLFSRIDLLYGLHDLGTPFKSQD